MGVLQALEDGRVLAVHRQQMHPVLLYSVGDQPSAGDQTFLVGQGHVVAALDGGQGGAQTGDAHHGVEHNAGGGVAGQFQQALAAPQQPGRLGQTSQQAFHPVGTSWVGDYHHLGRKLPDLLHELLNAGMGGQAVHGIALVFRKGRPYNPKAISTPTVTKGAIKSRLSNRSRIPPWPGKI